MRITQEADYAIRFVHILAKQPDVVQGAAQLSRLAVTPERYTLKILHKLKHCGIVKSTKGAHGGYCLAKKPEELSLKMIIEAIDGEIALSKCMGEEPCSRMGVDKQTCCFHRIFCTISQEVADRLARITIADVLAQGTCVCEE
ncbi:MAG: Rrf2 family transcriptional regulator [Clostridia bacterium]|nr:Rrf2 family transcriptional regulator [Clostridia bacterium]